MRAKFDFRSTKLFFCASFDQTLPICYTFALAFYCSAVYPKSCFFSLLVNFLTALPHTTETVACFHSRSQCYWNNLTIIKPGWLVRIREDKRPCGYLATAVILQSKQGTDWGNYGQKGLLPLQSLVLDAKMHGLAVDTNWASQMWMWWRIFELRIPIHYSSHEEFLQTPWMITNRRTQDFSKSWYLLKSVSCRSANICYACT